MTTLVRKAGSATEPGEITLDPQVIAGAKTFNAAMTMGATVSTSISGAQHLVNGAFNCGATGTTDAAKRFGINCNVNVNQTWATSRNSASSTLGGCALFLIARTSDATQSFQLYSNLASDNDSANPVLTLSSNQRGEWTAGRSDTINLSTVYQHTFISGGRTQLDITSTGNAASTGGAAVLRLRATGESGAQFSWYRGTDGGTFDTNATIKWNWVHGGNGALMTGGGVDSIAFYSYGIGNYMGQLCYDGRWFMGPETTPLAGIFHKMNGSLIVNNTYSGHYKVIDSFEKYSPGGTVVPIARMSIGSQGTASWKVTITQVSRLQGVNNFGSVFEAIYTQLAGGAITETIIHHIGTTSGSGSISRTIQDNPSQVTFNANGNGAANLNHVTSIEIIGVSMDGSAITQPITYTRL